MLSRKNEILNFEKLTGTKIGNITLDSNDIGGNYLRMKLTKKYLHLDGIPLQHYKTFQEAFLLKQFN